MIEQIEIGGFDKNFSYFVVSGKEVAVVDPDNFVLLESLISEAEYKVVAVLITHTHFDHVGGVKDFVKEYGVPVYMHEKAKGRITVGGEVILVKDGAEISVGDLKVRVIYTPGHIDDAVCYYVEEDQSVITGDTLFVEGCGRADLEGSDVKDLWESLARLKGLPDDVKVYPGHDYGSKPVSDIGHEKNHNRFLKCENFEEFKKERMG